MENDQFISATDHQLRFNRCDGSTVRVRIESCGDFSITGCIVEQVIEKGLYPAHIVVDIERIHLEVDVMAELAHARRILVNRPFTIELGKIKFDPKVRELA